jgi:hypothetical protein
MCELAKSRISGSSESSKRTWSLLCRTVHCTHSQCMHWDQAPSTTRSEQNLLIDILANIEIFYKSQDQSISRTWNIEKAHTENKSPTPVPLIKIAYECKRALRNRHQVAEVSTQRYPHTPRQMSPGGRVWREAALGSCEAPLSQTPRGRCRLS